MPNKTVAFKRASNSGVGSGANELQDKAREIADWRTQVHERPLAALAVAFGGGLLLGAVLGGTVTREHDQPSGAMKQVNDVLSHMKGAFVGIASTKAVEYLDGIIPGFQEHYSKHAGR